jgi:hypothetical protein
MGLKHKVTINVTKPGGRRDAVIHSGSRHLRERICRFLFGEKVRIMVLTPGDSVETVEIREVKEEADG